MTSLSRALLAGLAMAVLFLAEAGVGSDSLLLNSEFKETESGGLSGGAVGQIPRDWRRAYFSANRRSEAEADFRVRKVQRQSFLEVEKTVGGFVLSAAPVVPGSTSSPLVAEAILTDMTGPSPTILLQQLGRTGLLKEERFDQVVMEGRERKITSPPIPLDPNAKQARLFLSFPSEAGIYRVRSVGLLSLDPPRHDLRILVDQGGYNASGPLRFLVRSSLLPVEGQARFEVSDAGGLRYRGDLVPLGKTLGQHEADWGGHFFEGHVPDPSPGTYHLAAFIDNASTERGGIRVGPSQRLKTTGELAYRFYSVQRCGCAVEGWHEACHVDDGALPDGRRVDVSGGFHSAGDSHKHMGDNAPISVYGMVSAHERAPGFFDTLDRDGNGRADLLDEAAWGADWFLKMVDPQSGHLWANVTNDIEYYGLPEQETDGIPGTADDRVIGVGDPADLGAWVIASWAALARQHPESSYLASAESLWRVYRERMLEGHDPRSLFAALELYRTTRREEFAAAADILAPRVLELQHKEGWFARTPGGGPEFNLVDEGVTPAALAFVLLHHPESIHRGRIRSALRLYFEWSLRMADNPFGLIRHLAGGEPQFFPSRASWFGGANSAYLSTAWAAYLSARTFEDEPAFAGLLREHAANQVHWVLGLNPLDLCMLEGVGSSSRIHYHHLLAESPDHPRGAVPGAIPNGIAREPGNSDRPWFDFRDKIGSLPGAETCEPWLPHNAFFLLMLSAEL